MFAVQLLDTLAEAVVLLIFDFQPTQNTSEDDDDCNYGCKKCIMTVRSSNSLDSNPSRQVRGVDIASNNSMSGIQHVGTSPTPSADGSTFVVLSEEEVQQLRVVPLSVPRQVSAHEQESSCGSTLSGWSAFGQNNSYELI